jgi:hypothetical protein
LQQQQQRSAKPRAETTDTSLRDLEPLRHCARARAAEIEVPRPQRRKKMSEFKLTHQATSFLSFCFCCSVVPLYLSCFSGFQFYKGKHSTVEAFIYYNKYEQGQKIWWYVSQLEFRSFQF